jgi:hypothetical protein
MESMRVRLSRFMTNACKAQKKKYRRRPGYWIGESMLSLALRTIFRLLAGHLGVAYAAMMLRHAANRQFRSFHAED